MAFDFDISSHTVETAFTAVKNNNIAFRDLCDNVPKREVKNYLVEAIGDCLIPPWEETEYQYTIFPHGLEFYQGCYKEFGEWYSDSHPEYFI